MRIRIDHRTTYSYERPARDIVQKLRLTPRDHEGQRLTRWRIELSCDSGVRRIHDPFGNIVHMIYPEGLVSELVVRVSGEAEVADMAGVVRGAPEPLRPAVFLRQTPLTQPDEALKALAEDCRREDTLDALHGLMVRIHRTLRFDPGATDVTTTAAEAWGADHGVCQDFAHVFLAAARRLGIAARYVSGHLARTRAQDAAHAWAEAYVPYLGWVAFDPANAVCATDDYLRVATGLDYLDAAPVRGARRGGGMEAMQVAVQAGDIGSFQQ